MTRIILSILRQAAEPLTTRDIALQLLVELAPDKNDLRLLKADDQAGWCCPSQAAGQRPAVNSGAGAI